MVEVDIDSGPRKKRHRDGGPEGCQQRGSPCWAIQTVAKPPLSVKRSYQPNNKIVRASFMRLSRQGGRHLSLQGRESNGTYMRTDLSLTHKPNIPLGIASEEGEAGLVYGRAERCHRRWGARPIVFSKFRDFRKRETLVRVEPR